MKRVQLQPPALVRAANQRGGAAGVVITLLLVLALVLLGGWLVLRDM